MRKVIWTPSFSDSTNGTTLKREIDLCPHRMVMIVPGARHQVVFEVGQAADLKVICVTAQDTATYLSPVQADLLDNLRDLGSTYSDCSTELPILTELLKLIPEGSVVGNRRELLIVWNVIGLLLATHASDEYPAADEVEQRHRSRIQDVCGWLDRHLDQDANLDEIAAEFGLSRGLLTRTFRRHTGTSVVHYVNARRLEKAAVLLTSSTERSITQAAI